MNAMGAKTALYPLSALRSMGLALAFIPLLVACSPKLNTGSVVIIDAVSRAPIEGAVVVASGQMVRTDREGMAYLPAPPSHLAVRAVGYGRTEADIAEKTPATSVIRLSRVTPKALYLSVYGIGDARLRNNALKLLKETELNALVIDVKGDRGIVPYHSRVARASEVGAQRTITVRDLGSLIASLHARGIYTIARLVTFKDDKLARAHPDWAVRAPSRQLWFDREGLAWSDPFRQEVWTYNLDLAEEAARLGFDEIQFDYVRFPDEPGLTFSRPSTRDNRVAAVTGFLSAAAKRLGPYNVFVSADVFGYVLWNADDTSIGQRLGDLAGAIDYISPMLYASAFQFGVPGYRNPVAHPYEVVSLSLRHAQRRTGLPGARFRPWLQAFDDYAFGGRHFGARQIAEQIQAAEECGSNGWMLWNPRNVYTADGLKKKPEDTASRLDATLEAAAINHGRAPPKPAPVSRTGENKKPVCIHAHGLSGC
jgi:hypothetical protein